MKKWNTPDEMILNIDYLWYLFSINYKLDWVVIYP